MSDDRRSIAWTLSRAAQLLPPAERQLFREFLNSLPGGEPKRRKVHSWKRKAKKKRTVRSPKKVLVSKKARLRTDPQIPLPFDD